jgi:hypothetical protein
VCDVFCLSNGRDGETVTEMVAYAVQDGRLVVVDKGFILILASSENKSKNNVIYDIKLSYKIHKRTKNSAIFFFYINDHFTEHVCLLKEKY